MSGPGYAGVAYRPRYKTQDPDENGGYSLGWLSCTAYAFAMFAERATLGRVDVSGRRVRELISPADHVGGTNLSQMDQVARVLGVPFVPRIGSNHATPAEIGTALYQGKPVEVQLWTGPFIGTPWQTTRGGVNHAGLANEGRDFRRTSSGVWIPDEVLWYDPAGDGDNGRDQSPSWVPFDLLMRAAARLNVGDPAEGYVALGSGRAYAGFGPDTEPHVILRYGGQKTDPFPDRTRALPPKGRDYVNVRSRPDRIQHGDIVDRIPEDELFTAFQVTTRGAKVAGSTHWRGNQDGTRWIPNARLSNKGGPT